MHKTQKPTELDLLNNEIKFNSIMKSIENESKLNRNHNPHPCNVLKIVCFMFIIITAWQPISYEESNGQI